MEKGRGEGECVATRTSREFPSTPHAAPDTRAATNETAAKGCFAAEITDGKTSAPEGHRRGRGHFVSTGLIRRGVGRRGVGTMSACVADRLSSVEEILEWRPFEVFVRRSALPGGGRLSVQHELERDGDRTRLRVRWYGPRLTAPQAAVQRANLDRLQNRLEADDAHR